MWGGWYDDPSLMKELTDMKHLCDNASKEKGKSPRSEVVFFADERGYAHLFNASPQLSGINETRLAMGNTGVPYDTYMAEDAESILGNYKAAIFPMPIPSEAGIKAMELCEKMNIPYIRATAEHCSLTTNELCEFYKSCGLHFYTNEKDVVYVGNGYVGLHSATGGKKRLILPERYRVSLILDANVYEETTDIIEFDLEENQTALFYVSK